MVSDVDEAWGRVRKALFVAFQSGGVDGGHHKQWVIDQMVRALTGCPMVDDVAVDYKGHNYTFTRQGESEEYVEWVRAFRDGEDGPDSYEWDEGTPP